MVHLTVCSYHVMYAFQSESTLYSCLNVKELLAWSRHEIYCLSDCNCTRTHNLLLHKRTLNHLAKLAKWFSCVVSTYLYGAFDCMFLSCHIRVSVWLNGWVIVYEISDCGFEASCSHLNFKQSANILNSNNHGKWCCFSILENGESCFMRYVFNKWLCLVVIFMEIGNDRHITSLKVV